MSAKLASPSGADCEIHIPDQFISQRSFPNQDELKPSDKQQILANRRRPAGGITLKLGFPRGS